MIGDAPAGAPPTGRRESNKREKLVRIRAAARDVFLRKGYEAATVREIASLADVAFGTLFLYAKNKQDLLMLLYDEELPEMAERGSRNVDNTAPFLEQLLTFFSEFYDFFSATPQLSRDMLREITFGGGIVATRIWTGLQSIEHHVARLVARAQADGRISSGVAPDLAGHIIFSLYRVEIRYCLSSDEPDVAASISRLRQQYDVLLTGLAPR